MSEPLIYAPLLNREYRGNEQDCWSCTRDFYNLNFALDFPDYSRPDGWWHQGLNLYRDLLFDLGFQPVHEHPMHWRPSDLFVMQIQAKVWNHSAVLIENSARPQILHHFYNRRSLLDPYRGLWKQTTMAVLRHRDIDYTSPLVMADISTYIPSRRAGST